MQRTVKAIIRDSIPERLQVPLKYWYNKLLGSLEEETELLPRLLHHAARVIDVGANRGVYAYPLARMCAHVELFEPNPKCAAVLKSWATKHPNVQVHAVALSNEEGVVGLQVPVDAMGVEHDSSACIEKFGSGRFREYRVQLKTLDSFKFRDVAFIKIDVEGHEWRVIDGAVNTINANMPALLIEIEQRHCAKPIEEVFKQVLDLGYAGFFRDASDTMRSLLEFDPAKHQLLVNLGGRRGDYINNFLFLHRSRLVAGEYNSVIHRA